MRPVLHPSANDNSQQKRTLEELVLVSNMYSAISTAKGVAFDQSQQSESSMLMDLKRLMRLLPVSEPGWIPNILMTVFDHVDGTLADCPARCWTQIFAGAGVFTNAGNQALSQTALET
eukprot:jgi/Hompol1/5925/HPOL_002128-RA